MDDYAMNNGNYTQLTSSFPLQNHYMALPAMKSTLLCRVCLMQTNKTMQWYFPSPMQERGLYSRGCRTRGASDTTLLMFCKMHLFRPVQICMENALLVKHAEIYETPHAWRFWIKQRWWPYRNWIYCRAEMSSEGPADASWTFKIVMM